MTSVLTVPRLTTVPSSPTSQSVFFTVTQTQDAALGLKDLTHCSVHTVRLHLILHIHINKQR